MSGEQAGGTEARGLRAERVRAEVIALARKELRRDLPEALIGGADLAEHLDSMQRISLAVAVEDHFRICLPEEAEAEIRGLPDLVAAICAELERQEAGAAAGAEAGAPAGEDAADAGAR